MLQYCCNTLFSPTIQSQYTIVAPLCLNKEFQWLVLPASWFQGNSLIYRHIFSFCHVYYRWSRNNCSDWQSPAIQWSPGKIVYALISVPKNVTFCTKVLYGCINFCFHSLIKMGRWQTCHILGRYQVINICHSLKIAN